MKKSRAVITVFFSLLSILFLGLSFTIVEAVRYRCVRSHCADLTAVGNWSVFGEYENKLLEKFDLFGIDTSDSGSFPAARLDTRLKFWLDENADVTGNTSEKLPGLTFDPFQVKAESADVSEYALLSDKNGEYFYQQAVEFMHKTAWMDALGELSESARSARSVSETQEIYKEAKKHADSQMANLKKQTAQNEAEAQKAASDQAQGIAPDPSAAEKLKKKKEAEKVKNPLWKMITLGFRSILPLVLGDNSWSKKKIRGGSLLSDRSKNAGNLQLETPRGGITDDLLFREYLADHFPCYGLSDPDKEDDGPKYQLDYQLEYILCGTSSDARNLKKTVKKILLIREAYNYLYLQKDPASLRQTESLAALILGWTGNAGLVETLREIFVVYWAYGESLYDVRMLMHNGKVPLIKTPADWHVPLTELYDLESLLRQADHTSCSGEDYADYLRLLLNMQSASVQKKRSLDLVESDLRQIPGMEAFRADCCVIAMKDSCSWSVSPAFSFVPEAFMGQGLKTGRIKIEGGFAY